MSADIVSDSVPVTPSPVTAGAIPWYASADQRRRVVTTVVIVGTALAPKTAIIRSLGLDDTMKVTGYVTSLADLMPALVAIGSIVWGFVKRFSPRSIQPTTFTAAGAAAHPSTIAVVQTQTAMANAGIPTAVTLQRTIESASTVQPLEIPK